MVIRSLTGVLIALCCVSSSCGPLPVQEGKPSQVPPTSSGGEAPPVFSFVDDGVTVESYPVQGSFGSNAGPAISPDGKYILGTLPGSGSPSVAAFPLQRGLAPIEFAGLPSATPDTSRIARLGWVSDTECVFLMDGILPPGGSEGEPGVAVYQGRVSDGSSRVISFIPGASCRQGAFYPGEIRGEWLLPGESKVYLHLRVVENAGTYDVWVYRAFWEVDLRSGKARLLKGKLPTYDGLFRAALTSDGRYFTYELHEPDRSGIFVLETATCEERALLPDGLTKSFGPVISPDGRFVAAYVAGQIKDESGNAAGYDVYPHVDGLRPAAHSLQVVDMIGREMATVDMGDKVITDMQWSADSRSLSFQVGTMTKVEAYEYDFGPESIWMMQWPVAGTMTPLAPVQVAAIPDEHESQMQVEQHPTADGVGVVWSADQGDLRLSMLDGHTTIIRLNTEPNPQDGWWRIPPETLGGFALEWLGDPGRGLTELWLLGSDVSRRVASYSSPGEFKSEVVAVGAGKVVVYRRTDPPQAGGFLDVFTFTPEYLDQKAWAAKSPWDRVKAAVARALPTSAWSIAS